MSDQSLILHYDIDAVDFSAAGEASSGVKRTLNKIGVNPAVVKRVAIAMYEAEINAIIHAGGGEADIEITPEKVIVKISDHGNDCGLVYCTGKRTGTRLWRRNGTAEHAALYG